MGKERKRYFRWTNNPDSVRKKFENIIMNKMPKSDQINFIDSQTDGAPEKLKALRDDLDVFLLDLESWEGARKFLNQIAQKYNPDFDAINEINEFSELLNKHINSANSSWHELLSDEVEIPSKTPKNSEVTQIGRPEDFPSNLTKQWFNELKELEAYQHKNGKPHKTNIKKEIIIRHGKSRNDGQKPSMDTINTQFRKLGLTS